MCRCRLYIGDIAGGLGFLGGLDLSEFRKGSYIYL